MEFGSCQIRTSRSSVEISIYSSFYIAKYFGSVIVTAALGVSPGLSSHGCIGIQMDCLCVHRAVQTGFNWNNLIFIRS